MPKSGVKWIPHEEILSFEEILRLVALLARLGIRKIKITGGEPLVRKGVTDLIRALKDLPGIEQLTLTTNGILLPEHLESLIQSGISAVNISLNTVNQNRYRLIAGTDHLKAVLSGIQMLAGRLPVKINVVPIKGMNEADLLDLAAMAKDQVAAVRFIELMPVGQASAYEGMSSREIIRLLSDRFGLMHAIGHNPDAVQGNGPAEYWSLPGFAGKIGFIHAMSAAFCADCNRIRLTVDGRLMPCLGGTEGVNLKMSMRRGADDQTLLTAMKAVIEGKPACHTFLDETGGQPRIMNRIGG
jgi:cyclic pyranopterin phosphate synthase